MVIRLYDFDYAKWLNSTPQWVKDAPDWVQQRLANTPAIAADPDGSIEKVAEDHYWVRAKGFIYGCRKSMDWVR